MFQFSADCFGQGGGVRVALSRLEDVAGVGVGKNIPTPARTYISSVIVIRLLKSLNAYYAAYVCRGQFHEDHTR